MTGQHRVLLVHPGTSEVETPTFFPPWGGLCVGAALRERGIETRVLDLNGCDIESAIHKEVEEYRPTVLGITGKVGVAAHRMKTAIATARSVRPEVRVAVGGPLVSSYPARNHEIWNGVDLLVIGDGERVLPDWVEGGCPPVAAAQADQQHDLDRFGIPLWWPHLGDYVHPPSAWPNMNVPAMHISGGRGCTRRCTFCYLNTHYSATRFRFVSPALLIRAFDALAEQFGVAGFYFVDDCIIDDPPARLLELCKRLADRGSPYALGCDVQLQDLENAHLLESMYSAGFRCLYVGIESASPFVRRRLGKGIVRTSPEDVLRRTIDRGFLVRASIGMGWPGETAAEVEETLRLIERVPKLVFDPGRYLPLPGVPLTKYWDKHSNRASSCDHDPFEDFSWRNANYSAIPDDRFRQLWSQLVRLAAARFRQEFGASILPENLT